MVFSLVDVLFTPQVGGGGRGGVPARAWVRWSGEGGGGVEIRKGDGVGFGLDRFKESRGFDQPAVLSGKRGDVNEEKVVCVVGVGRPVGGARDKREREETEDFFTNTRVIEKERDRSLEVLWVMGQRQHDALNQRVGAVRRFRRQTREREWHVCGCGLLGGRGGGRTGRKHVTLVGCVSCGKERDANSGRLG